jgi:hypothetical protein
VTAAGVLDKHDIPNDRMIEEILHRVQEPDGLFWMSRYIFGRDRLREDVHAPLAVWYKEHLAIPNALLSIRDPRGSGKSTMLVEDMPPWLVIQKPIPGTIFRGLNSRLALMAPKVSLASIRVSAHMKQFENQVYRELVGDFVRPDPACWSITRGLRVLRDGPGGESTVLPVGLDSITTQLHPPLVIVDDAVHEKNWMSLPEMARAKMCVELSYNLTRSESGVRVIIGNKWAVDDVQDSLRKSELKYANNLHIWERGMICCPECLGGRRDPEAESRVERHVHGAGEVANPTICLLSITTTGEGEGAMRTPTEADAVEIYSETAPEISSAQYDNDPQPPGSSMLDYKLWKFWEWSRGGDPHGNPQIVITASPERAALYRAAGSQQFVQSGGKGHGARELINLYDLDMYILIDPASSIEEAAGHCRFAFVVVGCERVGPRMFVLEEYAKNDPAPKHYNAILDSWVRWFPDVRAIAYESVGYQATIGDTLLMQAHARDIRTLQPTNLKGLSRLRSEGQQMDRIRYSITSWLTSGLLYTHPTQKLLMQETKMFGIKGAKHDILDALSNLARVRVKGARRRGGGGTKTPRKNVGFTGYGCRNPLSNNDLLPYRNGRCPSRIR